MAKRRRPTEVDEVGPARPVARSRRTKPAPAAVSDDTPSAPASAEPSDEDIRLRAYHRYLERGGGHGMDFEDWLEAERELKRKH
jgi:hypothetical protein